MKLKFELTNEQRKYLGLIPVEEDWELVKLNYKYENIYFYFDGDIIRKNKFKWKFLLWDWIKWKNNRESYSDTS